MRAVGWAIRSRHVGLWLVASGWLVPGASVAAGEAVAVAMGFELLNPWGLSVTDCLAVKRMWDRFRRHPHSVVSGVSLSCWLLLASALAKHPTAKCVWMRSHRSAEEARAAGYPPAWHEGNAKADEAAKAAALAHDLCADPSPCVQIRVHCALDLVIVYPGPRPVRFSPGPLSAVRYSPGPLSAVRYYI